MGTGKGKSLTLDREETERRLGKRRSEDHKQFPVKGTSGEPLVVILRWEGKTSTSLTVGFSLGPVSVDLSLSRSWSGRRTRVGS